MFDILLSILRGVLEDDELQFCLSAVFHSHGRLRRLKCIHVDVQDNHPACKKLYSNVGQEEYEERIPREQMRCYIQN